MALNIEDIKLITDLQFNMEKRLVDAIKGQGTGMRAKIESEVNRIEEMDKIRNGKIRCNEEEVDILKDETKIARWIQCNKKTAVTIFIVVVAAIGMGMAKIDVKRSIEKAAKIELRDENN